MRLNAASLQPFARFTGCALHFAGRFVSVTGRVCGYALTPAFRGLFFTHLGDVFQIASVGLAERSLSRRGSTLCSTRGVSPHCAIGSLAPLIVLGRSTLAAPPMPAGETLGRLRLSALAAAFGLAQKGRCPFGNPALAAVGLGCWFMRSLCSLLLQHQSRGFLRLVSINPLSRHILALTGSGIPRWG